MFKMGKYLLLLILSPLLLFGAAEIVTVNKVTRTQIVERVHLTDDENRFRALAPIVTNDVVILSYLTSYYMIPSLWTIDSSENITPNPTPAFTNIGVWIHDGSGDLQDNAGTLYDGLWEVSGGELTPRD